jgi:hypothetical protein
MESFARMMAPASRRAFTTSESSLAMADAKAREEAVVAIPSDERVAILSLTAIGMPNNGLAEILLWLERSLSA